MLPVTFNGCINICVMAENEYYIYQYDVKYSLIEGVVINLLFQVFTSNSISANNIISVHALRSRSAKKPNLARIFTGLILIKQFSLYFQSYWNFQPLGYLISYSDLYDYRYILPCISDHQYRTIVTNAESGGTSLFMPQNLYIFSHTIACIISP